MCEHEAEDFQSLGVVRESDGETFRHPSEDCWVDTVRSFALALDNYISIAQPELMLTRSVDL